MNNEQLVSQLERDGNSLKSEGAAEIVSGQAKTARGNSLLEAALAIRRAYGLDTAQGLPEEPKEGLSAKPPTDGKLLVHRGSKKLPETGTNLRIVYDLLVQGGRTQRLKLVEKVSQMPGKKAFGPKNIGPILSNLQNAGWATSCGGGEWEAVIRPEA